MNQNLIKMYFDKTLFRVRLVFKPDDLDLVVSFDPFIVRVRDRMEQIKHAGQISQYVVYAEDFRAMLEKGIGHLDPQESAKEFDCVVAQGFPQIHGMVPSYDEAADALKVLFKPAPELLNQWRWEWILAYAEKFVENRAKRPRRVDAAALRGLWLAAVKGMKPVEGLIPLLDGYKGEGADAPFRIATHAGDGDVGLVVQKPEAIRSQESRHAMFEAVQKEIQRLAKRNGRAYALQTEDIKLEMKALLLGIHAFGFGLPVSFLVAKADPAPADAKETPAPVRDAPKAAAPEGERHAAPAAAPVAHPAVAAGQAPRLHFEVSRDGMAARIVRFDPNLYVTHADVMTIDWLRSEVKRGKFANHDPSLDGALQKLIAAKGDLTGAVVAVGKRPVTPAGPYVKLEERAKGDEKATVNFREKSRFQFFREGELVARVHWKVTARGGMDVRGVAIPAPEPEPYHAKLGPGIEERAPGQFFAATNGIVTLKDEELSLQNTLVVNGDVNLGTGNIDFPGAVVVTGYVDVGARVICDGPLVIEKGIAEAVVKCRGNVLVKEGIVTGKAGYVYAGGELRAEFVQNARVRVRGDLIVKGSILNSHVVVDGNILVQGADGVIAGGEVSSFGSIATQNLGLRKGTHTVVHLGTRFEVEKSLRLKEARLELCKAAIADAQKRIREMRTRHKMQKQMEKLEEAVAGLQARLERWQAVKDKTHARVLRLREQVSYNPDAVLRVRGEALRTVEIFAGGKEVPRLSDLLEAVITVKTVRGKNIFQLDEYEKAV